ncbi:hypothetical protein WH52_01165 [Tenacibaculum holothuriorum]|uniref:Uncharacterized protein n=1 Tax=Tenacibaculum holothuriorum TaxID=1635173 RepID=A0A1Y2PFM6_9FLAO|nr:lipase family protein [Tenacibaculum holothuriorum]OSY89284.1 hypothetical protein WH52_01165 [Tenacibaculum holothuriorum]
MKNSLFFLSIVLLFLTSCNNNDDVPVTLTRGELISSTFVKTISASEINNLFPEKSNYEGDITNLPNYDISLYSVVYRSIHAGEPIDLSGLIIVPSKKGELSQVQYHHGTMLPYPAPNGEGSLDAPSLYNGLTPTTADAQFETRLFGNYLASHGYVVSMPDYSGYAISDNVEHPYSVNNMLAEQSVDLILATKEFCQQQNIQLNNKTFLSGWSEGGAVTLATQKLIEAQYSNQISVTASAPLAGFYNTTPFASNFLDVFPFTTDDLGEGLDVFIWTLYSLNAFSENPVPFDDIFKYTVDDALDVLANRPSSVPAELFKELSQTTKAALLANIEAHSLITGWTPVAPIYMYHGTFDDIVFYEGNADATAQSLNTNGGTVELITYQGYDHYTPALLFLLDMVTKFDQL